LLIYSSNEIRFIRCYDRILLNEYLLNLAVSRANDVQTLLQLSNLYAVNSEELCLVVSNLSVDCADAVNNRLYNLKSCIPNATTVREDTA